MLRPASLPGELASLIAVKDKNFFTCCTMYSSIKSYLSGLDESQAVLYNCEVQLHNLQNYELRNERELSYSSMCHRRTVAACYHTLQSPSLLVTC